MGLIEDQQMFRNHGSTSEPLLEAIKMGRQQLANEKLTKADYSDLEYQGESQDGTPLYWAAAKGFEDLVRVLLLLGASVGASTIWGGTALHAAADNGHDHIVDILLANGANVDARTSSGDTPCHLAAYRGCLKATMRLVEGGANTRSRNDQGNDVMREAVQNRRYEVVKYLWSFIKSDYKTPTVNGDTKDIIPESTVVVGNCHDFPIRKHSYNQKPRSEDHHTLVRRSSVPPIDYNLGARLQQQTYPPATRRCSGFQAAHDYGPVYHASERPPISERNRGRPQQDVPMRYFSSSALYCQSELSTPTPSEDEVDWDTSLCVDEDKFKSKLWGNERWM
ncbi:26S proteasome non-ATPase regulatory subunit 10-like [Lineus longissimus]|uniref:26S proteasome non-ATPase regulatory subunit 10-like n=1 Tax=Lineus longissimus TaxID=88925 RepID=UPI00315D3914